MRLDHNERQRWVAEAARINERRISEQLSEAGGTRR
jgi:hypothetical protein